MARFSMGVLYLMYSIMVTTEINMLNVPTMVSVALTTVGKMI